MTKPIILSIIAGYFALSAFVTGHLSIAKLGILLTDPASFKISMLAIMLCFVGSSAMCAIIASEIPSSRHRT